MRGDGAVVEPVRLADEIVVSSVVQGELPAGFAAGEREAATREEAAVFLRLAASRWRPSTRAPPTRTHACPTAAPRGEAGPGQRPQVVGTSRTGSCARSLSGELAPLGSASGGSGQNGGSMLLMSETF